MPDKPAPPGWRWTLLTDVARLETGHTPSRKHPEYWGGDVPWIGIRDATENHGRVINDTFQHTNELGIANSSARILPADTVCLSRTASVGYVVVMGRPMATSQDFVNWVCSDRLDHRYLRYVLLAEQAAFLRFASGTTHQTIYFPEVKAFHVCLPPLPVQQGIAEMLSSLDEKIEVNRRMDETLEGMAHATFLSWLVEFDPVRAKVEERDTGLPRAIEDLFPNRFVESELGNVPDGWRVARIPEVIDVNPVRHLAKGVVAPYLDMGGMPTTGHSAGQVVERAFGSGMKFVNGDTLLARITPCLENGKTALVDFLIDGQVGWGSTEYIVLRPKPPLPPVYAYCLARSPRFRDFAIQSMTGSSGRQRVPAESLRHYLVASPPPAIAREFGEIAGAFLARGTVAAKESRALIELRDTLLPRLISGRISVKTAEKFVA